MGCGSITVIDSLFYLEEKTEENNFQQQRYSCLTFEQKSGRL
jgi:hypothetical protein